MALYLLYRGIRDRRYFTNFQERLGFLPASFDTTASGGVWFHAVSVGEVLSAVELIRRVRAKRPHMPVYLSTTTLAGRAAAEQRVAGLAAIIFFAPIDYRSTVRRVLRKLRPAAVVILETEIWPNLYRESKRAGASLLVVNGRISERALKRYRALRGFFRHVLMQPDWIFAQSGEDARRYAMAGAPAERVRDGGNLKYDFTPPQSGIAPQIAALLDRLRPDPVWIAASTMPPLVAGDPDEDDVVVDAFHTLAAAFPTLLLVLAPRRPERFDAVAEKLARAGIAFVRRSSPGAVALPGVLLLDSIGELAALFERASVVFMGGTLAARGGHNILEPAYFAKPVVAGPHMENFSAIAQEFTAHDALVRVGGAGELAPALARLLKDPARAAEIGAKARALTADGRGSVDRMAGEILQACEEALPNPLRILPARLLLTPLSWVWRAGHRLNLARHVAARQALHTKVVSVGGLTMGGSGKSPVVAHLAELLDGMGLNVAILTRGYGRKQGGEIVVAPKGQPAPVEETGDEAQMSVRAGHAHIGIGRDRLKAGRRIEEELKPGIFLLDDGFQHVRLKRDEDLVLIDALDPLAGGIFPLGRRREPLQSLARATAVLVTRAQAGQGIAGIERLVRRHNAKAPIFVSRVAPRGWIEFETGSAVASLPGRVGAFCGLGEPRSFWRTLEELGMEVAFRRAFGDHHSYRPSELRRLAAQASVAGAQALVTTEKDIMNLPSGANAHLRPHKLWWLKIGIEIDNQQELLRRIL